MSHLAVGAAMKKSEGKTPARAARGETLWR